MDNVEQAIIAASRFAHADGQEWHMARLQAERRTHAMLSEIKLATQLLAAMALIALIKYLFT